MEFSKRLLPVYHTTRRHIPEHRYLNFDHCKNFKFLKIRVFWSVSPRWLVTNYQYFDRTWSVFLQGHVVEEYLDPVDERTALLWTVGKPFGPERPIWPVAGCRVQFPHDAPYASPNIDHYYINMTGLFLMLYLFFRVWFCVKTLKPEIYIPAFFTLHPRLTSARKG